MIVAVGVVVVVVVCVCALNVTFCSVAKQRGEGCFQVELAFVHLHLFVIRLMYFEVDQFC